MPLEAPVTSASCPVEFSMCTSSFEYQLHPRGRAWAGFPEQGWRPRVARRGNCGGRCFRCVRQVMHEFNAVGGELMPLEQAERARLAHVTNTRISQGPVRGCASRR